MLEFFNNNIDLLLKLLALGAVVVSEIRIMVEYPYSIDMQNYFTVPYNKEHEEESEGSLF